MYKHVTKQPVDMVSVKTSVAMFLTISRRVKQTHINASRQLVEGLT